MSRDAGPLGWTIAAILSVTIVAVGIGIPSLSLSMTATAASHPSSKTGLKHRRVTELGRQPCACKWASSADPDVGQGVVVVRGPFGIQTGEARIETQEEIERGARKELGAWALLAGATGSLLAVVAPVVLRPRFNLITVS